jgi:uncharacterized protein YhbP (UPF0306 family)
MEKKHLLQFLRGQKLLTLATSGESGLWIANAYYSVDRECNLYFVSSTEAMHSHHISRNPSVVFSVAWFDPKDHANRKAIQGRGTCSAIGSEAELTRGIRLHNQRFPEFRDRITRRSLRSEENSSAMWLIKPTYVKFWDDARYGAKNHREFFFA